MLYDLNRESLKVGLKMHKGKTRVMFNDKAKRRVISVDSKALEVVEEYNYLGQILKLTRDNEHELKMRIILGWEDIGRQQNHERFRSICLKRKVYNQCVLPTMIYGSETWKPTKLMENKHRITQKGMKRSMLGISLRGKKRASWIRENIKVKDLLVAIKEQKWRWAGHVARREDNKWNKRLTDWTPLVAPLAGEDLRCTGLAPGGEEQ